MKAKFATKFALLAALFCAAQMFAQPPKCVWVMSGTSSLACVAATTFIPVSIGPPGTTGATGAQGPAGPQGIPGPAGISGGGSCVSTDGSPALFVQLPDKTCLPLVISGNFIASATLLNQTFQLAGALPFHATDGVFLPVSVTVPTPK